MATATLQNLTDIGYDILREEEDVSAYPLAFMQQLMNTASLRIANWNLKNPFTGTSVQKGVLPFLRTQQFYATVAPVTTTVDLVLADIVITVADTTNYPTTGKLYIGWFITPYTGKTATTFTGCTAMPFPFESGTQVSIVYDLPTDYGTAVNLTYNQSTKLDPVQYDDIFERLNSYKQNGNNYGNNSYLKTNWYQMKPFYALKDNQYLLVYQLNANAMPLLFRYEKMPATMVATTDECFIPNMTYAKATIPYLAIGEMLYNRWEEWRASNLINFALWQVEEMFKFYNNTSMEDPSGTQYRMAKSPRHLNI